MKKLILTLLSIFLFCNSFLLAQQKSVNTTVKYISANHIYLNGGKDQGIAIDDTVKIIRGNETIAILKVIFVSDNSANCEVISAQGNIRIGDKARVHINHAVTKGDTEIQAPQSRTRTFEKSLKKEKKSKTRISGYLSTQWYQFIDANNGEYNFSQPTFRFSFRGRNLWEDDYNIRIRARSRYNDRSRRYSSNVPATEWRNRIYELSFSYDNARALFNYKLGRIISNKFSGVGYIDGAQLQHNVTENFNWGLFGGTQPQWQYSEFQTSYQKYGTYLNYVHGDYKTSRFESTLALAGTYHKATVSREVLFVQNNYNQNRKWNIYQSLEIDLNRDWRKKAAGEDYSLTGLYVNGRYYYNDNLNFGLSYDNRKNYYTYELRTLADSLFDDAFRQGVRLSVSYRVNKNIRIYGNSGIRKRENTDMTYSYAAGLNTSNLLNQRIALSARFAGFSNIYTQGWNPLINISKYFSYGHYLELGYGQYAYILKANNSSRLNQFVRAGGQLELPLNLFLYADYEYSFGDDSEGHRILAEIGYRF